MASYFLTYLILRTTKDLCASCCFKQFKLYVIIHSILIGNYIEESRGSRIITSISIRSFIRDDIS
jgi:hypothetical protein